MLPISPPYLAFSDWVGLLVVFLIFGGGGVLAKIVESINRSRAEFAALRAELASLRDTTTQYDLSFDTSLQRLERRVDQMNSNSASAPDGRPCTFSAPSASSGCCLSAA